MLVDKGLSEYWSRLCERIVDLLLAHWARERWDKALSMCWFEVDESKLALLYKLKEFNLYIANKYYYYLLLVCKHLLLDY